MRKIEHQGSRKDWLDVIQIEEDDQIVKLLDLDWIPQKWWQLITNQKTKKSYPDSINRRYFEMCVFSQVMWELKSGDLYVEDSDAFADYRTQQISWAEYKANIEEMEYLGSQDLRQTIQGALNKSEAFNGFTKWVGFGNAGMIQQNSREEQRKIIKYNHLVSNCLIFYNVFQISRILQDYIQAGNTIEKEILGALSPYLTKHINRFGSYSLDLNRKPPTLDFGFSLIPSS